MREETTTVQLVSAWDEAAVQLCVRELASVRFVCYRETTAVQLCAWKKIVRLVCVGCSSGPVMCAGYNNLSGLCLCGTTAVRLCAWVTSTVWLCVLDTATWKCIWVIHCSYTVQQFCPVMRGLYSNLFRNVGKIQQLSGFVS